MDLEVNKHHVKVQYNKYFHPSIFSEGDLVLLWDQAKEPLGAREFNLMWHGPYVVNVSWNISPSADSKVFHCSEWFRSRTNEGQRLKTLPGCHRSLECDASIVTLCTCD